MTIETLKAALEIKLGNPSSGRRRTVFIGKSGKYVWKLPHNSEGATDNEQEARIYAEWLQHQAPYNQRSARCRLVYINEVPLLCMERTTTEYLEDAPDWCYEVDDAQVGYNRKGILVAYDYGKI